MTWPLRKLGPTALLLTWLALSPAAWLLPGARADDQQPPPSAETESSPGDPLDAELFENLERDLGDLTPPGAADSPPATGEQPPAELHLPGETPPPSTPAEGADGLGPAPAESPLSRVGQAMREVQHRLGQRQTDDSTAAMQQQIVVDLEALLKQMQQRKGGKGKPGPSDPQKQASRRSQPQSGSPRPSGGKPSGQPGDGPADDSTPGVREQAAERPDPAEQQALLKALWGHLPQRVREQMLQASMDEFLPKYELLIEEYFKRLVRTRGTNP